MFIQDLSLTNYRNYTNEHFQFSPNLNVIIGNNAQGKTNSCEAIFYLCTGYSHRVTRDKQVINYTCTSAKISATAITNYGSVKTGINFYNDKNKKIKINGVEALKIGQLLGNINCVFFNPNDLKLIKESPEDRRRFLDVSLSQIDRNYFYSLQRYKKILTQRNNLLKNPDKILIQDTLPVWDIQLTKEASKIIKARSEFIALLAPLAKDAHAFITDNKENLTVECDYKYQGSLQDITDMLTTDLYNSLNRDMALGYTTVGPHRDDLKIKINDSDVRIYGSQGQQRSASISLKLAELEIFKHYFNEYPVLILDDALSELDKSRQINLLNRISNIQTIITCTHVDKHIEDNFKFKTFIIDNGKIQSQEIQNDK